MSASVRMRRKRVLRLRFVQGSRELASEVGRVSERTWFRSSSRSIGARSRALRSIAPDALLDLPVRMRMRCRLLFVMQKVVIAGSPLDLF